MLISDILDRFLRDPWGALVTLPIQLGFLVVALLAAITIHEFSHALVARRLGDPTATRLGRLTLNPLAHLDPLGTLMLVVVGFGWGKPVPVNPAYLRVGPRQGMALVSLAGPASNFLLAAALGLLVRADVVPLSQRLLEPWSLSWLLAGLVTTVISLNVVLGVFNLIPLPPLDGSKILQGVLPRDLAYSFARLEQYGPMILLGIVALDSFAGTGILSSILRPAMNLALSLILG